jgi:hypothetical protein
MSPELKVVKRARAMQSHGIDPHVALVASVADIVASHICVVAPDVEARDIGLECLIEAFILSVNRFANVPTGAGERVQ